MINKSIKGRKLSDMFLFAIGDISNRNLHQIEFVVLKTHTKNR